VPPDLKAGPNGQKEKKIWRTKSRWWFGQGNWKLWWNLTPISALRSFVLSHGAYRSYEGITE
jgi:hypothetical protein